MKKKSIGHERMDLFLDSQFYSVVLYACPYASIIHFDYITFVASFETRKSSPPTLFFFKILPLAISYKYENQLIYSCKNVHWNFDRVYTDSIDHCRQVLMF